MRKLTDKDNILIRDVLYNLSDTSGANDDYCKGLLVGVVSALMMYYTFKEALQIVNARIPEHTRKNLFPESWIN
jgi:hypothetical protein